MPRLRLATLRQQSRVSARRFSRLSCACAAAPPRGFACRRTRCARSEYSHALVLTASRSGKLASLAFETRLRSFLTASRSGKLASLAFKTASRFLRARSASALSPPPACAGTGRRVGRSHCPLCPRRRAPRVLAWRRFSASCRFFAFFALAARAGAPMQGLFTRLRSSLRVLRPSRLTQSNKTGILYN